MTLYCVLVTCIAVASVPANTDLLNMEMGVATWTPIVWMVAAADSLRPLTLTMTACQLGDRWSLLLIRQLQATSKEVGVVYR